MRLTGRGWALIVLVVLLAVAGALFGIQELYAISAAAAVLLVTCILWTRGRRWELRTAREVTPGRVPAGAPATVALAVRNRADGRSPVLAVRDPFDDGRHSTALAVPPLRPNETVRATYALPTTARGVFPVGPLTLELADPFGLVAVTRTGAPPSTLTVHPRIVRLALPGRSAGDDISAPQAQSVIGPQGGDFFAIREYRTGDDLRRVHWASTARLDELMIRQDEIPFQGRLTVGVDLRPETWRAGGLETALSAAASIIDAALADGVDVRLVDSAGTDSGSAAGPGHRAILLDRLAAADPAPAPAGTALHRLLGPRSGESLVLITGAGPAGRGLVASFPPGDRRRVTCVAIDPGRGPSTVGTDEGGVAGAIVLRGGIDQLPAAWARNQARQPAWRQG